MTISFKSFILIQNTTYKQNWNVLGISFNVESIGEGADFRAENSIQAVQPLFCLYCVKRRSNLIIILMKPTKNNLREELIYRINCLDDFINQFADEDVTLPFKNEQSILNEIINLIDIFGDRIGYNEFETSKYTPLKCHETKEPLKIGDKVKAYNSQANGVLHFDDYLNQYVIRNEFNQNHKCVNFIKINRNFDYSIDVSKVECRPNPHKKLW